MILKKISNYGTTHPVVARLAMQTHELLQWADLTKEQKDEVYLTYDGQKNRLLKCHEARDRLYQAFVENMEADLFNRDGTLRRFPHLIGLQGEIETILYEAKNYLRDLLSILNIFFDVNLDEAAYLYDSRAKGKSKVAQWATRAFGENDAFTVMLESEQEWTEELIRKRNAIEHPGGRSGTLQIHNFERVGKTQFMPPTWHRDDMPRTDIFRDLDVLLDNMLTLAEDLLVNCIVKNMRVKIIRFAQIPEDERNSKCPMRIRVILHEDFRVPRRSDK